MIDKKTRGMISQKEFNRYHAEKAKAENKP